MNKTSRLLLLTAVILMSCVNAGYSAESYKFALTDMTWAEFYAGETGKSSADLYAEGLDAVSSPTSRVVYRFTQLVSESNDL
ncbi:MAG: hypothetical protein IJR27_06640, partial [Synergistaceae bacterium]|nr:hypothetical protein [Synergistaceae bacterium]